MRMGKAGGCAHVVWLWLACLILLLPALLVVCQYDVDHVPKVSETDVSCVTVTWNKSPGFDQDNNTIVFFRVKYLDLGGSLRNTRPRRDVNTIEEKTDRVILIDDDITEETTNDAVNEKKNNKSRKKKRKQKKGKGKDVDGWKNHRDCMEIRGEFSCKLCRLDTGHKYKFKVFAKYENNEMVKSRSSDSVTVGRPPQQPWISEVGSPGSGTLFVKWSYENGRSLAPSHFILYYRPYGHRSALYSEKIVNGTERKVLLDGLSPMTRYELRVKAFSLNGESEMSSERVGQTAVVRQVSMDEDTTPQNTTQQSTQLLIIVLGAVLGCLIILLIIFIILCAWKQRQQRQIIIAMDEKIRNKYQDASQRMYFETSMSRKFNDPNMQPDAMVRPNPMFQLSSYLHQMRYENEPHEHGETEKLNSFPLENGRVMSDGMVDERPPTPPPPMDANTWHQVQKSHHKSPSGRYGTPVNVPSAPLPTESHDESAVEDEGIGTTPEVSTYRHPFSYQPESVPLKMSTFGGGDDDDDGDENETSDNNRMHHSVPRSAESDSEQGRTHFEPFEPQGCDIHFPPPPPTHNESEMAFRVKVPTLQASSDSADGRQLDSLDKSHDSTDAKQPDHLDKSCDSPNSKQPDWLLDKSHDLSHDSMPGAMPRDGKLNKRATNSPVTYGSPYNSPRAGSPYGSPYSSSRYGSKEKHKKRRKRAKTKGDTSSQRGNQTDQETVVSVHSSSQRPRESRPSEGDCSSEA